MVSERSIPSYIFLLIGLAAYFLCFFLGTSLLKTIVVIPVLCFLPGLIILEIINIQDLKKITHVFGSIAISLSFNIIVLWLFYMAFKTTNILLMVAFLIPLFTLLLYSILYPKKVIALLKKKYQLFPQKSKEDKVQEIISTKPTEDEARETAPTKAAKIRNMTFVSLIILLLCTGIVLTFVKKTDTITIRFSEKDNIYLESELAGHLKVGIIVESPTKSYSNATIKWECGDYSSSIDITINKDFNEYFIYLPIAELDDLKIYYYLFIDNELHGTLSSINPYFNENIFSTLTSEDFEKEMTFPIEERTSFQINQNDWGISQAEINVTHYQEEEEFNGLNLFSVKKENKNNRSNYSFNLLITDMNGTIIKERFIGMDGRGLKPAEFINSTTVLYGCAEGFILWNIYTDVSITYNIIGHHDYECNPNSNTIFTLKTYNPEINGTKYVFDIIKEFNLTGELVWSLNTMSFISHTQWCPYHDTISDGKRDLTHGNTVFYDVEEDIIYYNSRNTNTFYKINHSSSAVIWGLGEYGNFTLYDKYGRERESLFYHAHAVEKVDEYTFILFDNDHHNQTDSNSEKSRILEITIDETTMTANESWSWTGPKEYYSFYWGDADRLPNGNRLGAFGTKTHPDTDIGARLVEVNEAGEIVWEMNFPNSDDYIYGVYNMERVCTSPVINPQIDIISLLGKNVSIEWQIWYNFRSRQRVLGFYALYLNGNELESAPYLFDKFWRATTVEYSSSTLEADNTYNLTLVMADETGHTTIDSINVTVTLFYLQRGGSTTVEKGQEQAHISWKGLTVSPLSYELQVNGSFVDDGIWNGDEEITFDFRSFNVGSYFVQLTLFNNSLQVHQESVWLTVFPSIAPKITNAPTNQTIFWNDSLNLSWELFDQTPEAWAIYLNDVLQYTESWEIQDITAEWVIPILNEGKYNITFLAWDQVNLFSIHTIWLIILSPSPPVIASIPALDLVRWGEEGVTLVWEVHGGGSWQLLQNGSHIANGLIFGNLIEVPLADWWSRWLPGTYELTLQLLDINLEAAEARCFLTIWLGDAYANELIAGQSAFYRDGSLALGAPDGEYATIYEDYSNGYLTLDLGAGEEVVDGDGVDFTVWATGGNYRIWVGSNLTLPLIQAGTGQGEQSFILPDEIDEARYIRIEYFSGANVLLDAVEAIYYNLPEDPEEPTTLPSSTPITTTSKTPIPLIPVIFGFIFYVNFFKKLRSILMKRIERR